jgi:hypothetical protein
MSISTRVIEEEIGKKINVKEENLIIFVKDLFFTNNS